MAFSLAGKFLMPLTGTTTMVRRFVQEEEMAQAYIPPWWTPAPNILHALQQLRVEVSQEKLGVEELRAYAARNLDTIMSFTNQASRSGKPGLESVQAKLDGVFVGLKICKDVAESGATEAGMKRGMRYNNEMNTRTVAGWHEMKTPEEPGPLETEKEMVKERVKEKT